MQIPYGKENIKIPAFKNHSFEVLTPGLEQGVDAYTEIRKVLNHTINKNVSRLRKAKKIAIAVSDLTRNVPYKVLLPALLEKFDEYGIDKNKINILIGGGLHRPVKKEEYHKIINNEYLSSVQITSHDATDRESIIYMGQTSRGTPVYINKHYVEADFRIVTGIIEPHQFVGFTAGAKGLAIGLAGEQTIRANHSMLSSAGAHIAQIENNPVREDLEEIASMVGIDFLVNLVLNAQKEVVKVVAGDFIDAHREGVEMALKAQKVKVEQKADIAIVSPGGHPKDIDIYQAQKALTTAQMVLKEPDKEDNDKPAIILVAESPEGFGNSLFRETLEKYNSPGEVINAFEQQEFQMGVHKAYLWAKTINRARTVLVSDKINEQQAQILMVARYSTLEQALDSELKRYKKPCHIAVIPYGNSTIPSLEK